MMSVFFSPFLRAQEQVSPCSCVLCYAFSFQRRQNFIVRIAPVDEMRRQNDLNPALDFAVRQIV